MRIENYFERYYSMINKYIKQLELCVSDDALLNKAIAKRNKEIEEMNKNEK